MQGHSSFLRNHLVIPFIVFSLLVLILEFSNIDLFVADMIYHAEGGGWTLQNHYLVSDLLHTKAKNLVKIVAVCLLVVAILSQFISHMKPYRRAIWYLTLVMPLSGLLIGIGKEITHVDCPWDLLRYGGEHPYIKLFVSHPGDYKFGKCFPAAHAAAGFTFMALYFFLATVRPEWKWYGLAAGIILGILFGLTQQTRGAHFISHDLWTAAICWFNSLGWYWFLLCRETSISQIAVLQENDPESQDSGSLNGIFTTER